MHGLLSYRRVFVRNDLDDRTGGCRPIVLVAVFASVGAFLIPVSDPVSGISTFYYVQYDRIDERFLWANLTWENGVGGISWGPAPDGAPPGGSEDPTFRRVNFTSPPLANPLYLNASRYIAVDILFKNRQAATSDVQAGCYANVHEAGYNVHLWAGTTLIAGSIAPMNYQFNKAPVESDPAGFKRCPYRMPAEAVHIPAGVELRLELSFQMEPAHRFGVSAEYPSVLRLPIFSGDEARYRMPEVFPRLRPVSPGSDADASLLGRVLGPVGLGGAGLAAGLTGRSSGGRRARTAIVLLLVTAAWSGCLENAPSVRNGGETSSLTPRGTAVVSYDEGDGAVAAVGLGGIVGRVADPYGFPVDRAAVAVLATPHFSTTNANGLFSFQGLDPRAYTLRIDRDTFVSLETSVNVLANRTAKLDVTLVYDGSLKAGDRPHIHDYWNGQEEAVLYDGPLHSVCPATGPCQRLDEFFFAPKGADRMLIRPGTAEVNVTLEFDNVEACFSKALLFVQDNSDTDPVNWSIYPPRPSGESFHVRTTWEMTDVGHQLFSTWTFGVRGIRNIGCYRGTAQGIVDTQTGAPHIAVKRAVVKIHKGGLPLEARHPDHWRGADSIQVTAGNRWEDFYKGAPGFHDGVYIACQTGMSTLFQPAIPWWAELGGPTSPVPAASASLRIYVNQSRPTGVAGAAAPYGWSLYYKTGETPVEPYYPGSPVYRAAPAGEVSGDRESWTWTLSVKDAEVDGLYNKRSAWRFALVPDSREARCLDMYAAGGYAGQVAIGILRITMDATASRI